MLENRDFTQTRANKKQNEEKKKKDHLLMTMDGTVRALTVGSFFARRGRGGIDRRRCGVLLGLGDLGNDHLDHLAVPKDVEAAEDEVGDKVIDDKVDVDRVRV